MNAPLLKIENLKKEFSVTAGFFKSTVATLKAVDGIDLTLNKGEVVAIVGESGSGKSTAARAAIRLIEPTAGNIYFREQDLRALSKKELALLRPKMQIVFQDPFSSLNPRQTIGDAIGEPLRYHNIAKSKKEELERTEAILKQVGLSAEVMTRYPHQFSGGQQQRICIGRAIAMHPDLIICDEAVSALDVSVQAQILNLLIELRRACNLSYLFISHDLSIVRYISNRVTVMYLGKVMESAPTEALFSSPKHPYTQALLMAMPKRHPGDARKSLALNKEIPSPLNPPSGCPFRTRCPYAKKECQEPPPQKVVGNGDSTHIYHCIL